MSKIVCAAQTLLIGSMSPLERLMAKKKAAQAELLAKKYQQKVLKTLQPQNLKSSSELADEEKAATILKNLKERLNNGCY